MLDRMVQSLHARIASDATTPSKATKEYIDTRFENLFNRLKEYFDISLIKLESRVEKGNSDLLTHIAKEEADNTVIVSFMNDVSPMLKNYKNLQGFWYISSLIFLSISGISVFFFSVKWIVLKLVEHGL